MKYTLIFCFLPIFAFSQTKKHSFSFEVDAGYLRSFMGNNQYYFICDFGPCPSYDIRNEPLLSSYWQGLVNFYVNKRHCIGVGFLQSKLGYNQYYLIYNPYVWYHDEYSAEYNSYKIHYGLTILNGEKFSMGVASDLCLDRVRVMDDEILMYTDLKKQGMSNIVEAVFSYSFRDNIGLKVNFMFRTALTKYSSTATNGNFNRFGRGATIGVFYKI
ncbi:MAG: hypothetical protein GC192_09370 [Bacteroidetes bacterium]|nr:hypothetical protein [Bacteroidota bacterium]